MSDSLIIRISSQYPILRSNFLQLRYQLLSCTDLTINFIFYAVRPIDISQCSKTVMMRRWHNFISSSYNFKSYL